MDTPHEILSLEALPLEGLEQGLPFVSHLHPELNAAGGMWCWTEAMECLDQLKFQTDADVKTLKSRLATLREISWEKLHTGYWKDVPVAWRDLYSLVSISILSDPKSILLDVQAEGREDAIKLLDMALLMGGPRFSPIIHYLIGIHTPQIDDSENEPQTRSKKRKCEQISTVSVSTPISFTGVEIERIQRPSLTKFIRYSFFRSFQPLVSCRAQNPSSSRGVCLPGLQFRILLDVGQISTTSR